MPVVYPEWFDRVKGEQLLHQARFCINDTHDQSENSPGPMGIASLLLPALYVNLPSRFCQFHLAGMRFTQPRRISKINEESLPGSLSFVSASAANRSCSAVRGWRRPQCRPSPSWPVAGATPPRSSGTWSLTGRRADAAAGEPGSEV